MTGLEHPRNPSPAYHMASPVKSSTAVKPARVLRYAASGWQTVGLIVVRLMTHGGRSSHDIASNGPTEMEGHHNTTHTVAGA